MKYDSGINHVSSYEVFFKVFYYHMLTGLQSCDPMGSPGLLLPTCCCTPGKGNSRLWRAACYKMNRRGQMTVFLGNANVRGVSSRHSPSTTTRWNCYNPNMLADLHWNPSSHNTPQHWCGTSHMSHEERSLPPSLSLAPAAPKLEADTLSTYLPPGCLTCW